MEFIAAHIISNYTIETSLYKTEGVLTKKHRKYKKKETHNMLKSKVILIQRKRKENISHQLRGL